MKGYTIFIQVDADTQHRVDVPFAQEADAFAKWAHDTVGCPVGIYDLKTFMVRKTFGAFDETRV